jgi:UDP-glucose 4-epimerase
MGGVELRIVVTGAGLIGTHAARRLAESGHRVALYDLAPHEGYVRSVVGAADVALHRGDVTDLPALAALMAAQQTECVVHTAALIGGVAQRSPYGGFRTNIYGTVCVAEAARLAGASRMVYASTHGVYRLDACRDHPITEDDPKDSSGVYGASKLACEHVLEAYGHAYAMDVVLLRFTNLFGPGLFVAGSSGGQAFHAAVSAAAEGRIAPVLPSLKGTGEWLYAKDAARAVQLACERGNRRGCIAANIGSGLLADDGDVVAAIRAAVPEARFDDRNPPDRPRRSTERYQPFDLATARRELGFEPEFTLGSAVADYVQAIRAAQRQPSASQGG